jgi:sterol-4alpha-carboxylate 3-dehydrogenase (decarboxylating)
MDPVLVLGGCGALGHHIIKQLLETKKALDVTAFDIRTNVNRVPGAKYIQGSIALKIDVRRVLETVKPKVIMHTVSPQLMGHKNTHKLYENVNVGGTKILLDCIAETDHVKALVYTSSSSVVHNNVTDLVEATEEGRLFYWPETTEFYSHTKAMAEAVWAFSLGSRESAINRRMVKYLTMTRTFDISKAKERLGYKPQVNMQEGVKRAVQYYMAHESNKESN